MLWNGLSLAPPKRLPIFMKYKTVQKNIKGHGFVYLMFMLFKIKSQKNMSLLSLPFLG